MSDYVVRFGHKSPGAPGSLIPAGRIVHVEIDIIVPCDANRDQVEEWVESCLDYGGIGDDNPLYSHGLELMGDPTLVDTGATTDRLVRREEAIMAGVRMLTEAAQLRDQPAERERSRETK